MNCMCGTELIHGGDHDAADCGYSPEDWLMVSNLSCPDCGRFVLVLEPTYEDEKALV